MLAARPILARIALAMLAMVLGAELARAETRVALVIGNSKYVSADALKNPANDAAIVTAALSTIGFNVVLKQDVTKQDFEKALKEFARDASNADIALFYFAGQGVQFHGQNYLLPVDTNPIDSNDIESDSIALDRVLAAAGKAHATRIIVLDARGFAPITTAVGNADGMIVFYSVEAGKEADDGGGATNSPFAQAFAKRIVERSKKIEEIFHLVSTDVYASAHQFQHPEIEVDGLTNDVILNPAETNPAETAEDVWARIRKSTDKSTLQKFTRDFPDSARADEAQAALDKLDLEDRLRNEERLRQEMERDAAAVAADKVALEQRAAEERERLKKEKADKEAAARKLAEQEAEIEAQKKASKDLIAEEQTKARALCIGTAADCKKQEVAADAAKAKVVADACAREATELAQYREAQEIDAIQTLRSHSVCASLRTTADQAIKQIAAQKAKLCADDQKTLARVDPKNVEALKAILAAVKCPKVRDTASAQIAKLVDENLRTQKACANEREQFASIDLSVPDARNRLSPLPPNPACEGLSADIRSAIASVDRRVANAQDQLNRLGCYNAKPTGRFDGTTIVAIADYLKERGAPPDTPKITDAFVDELRQQNFVVCVAPSVGVAEARPSPTKRTVTLGSPSERPVPADTTPVPLDRKSESSLPEFPWPPPKSSAFYVLPNAFFAKTPTMGSAVKLILASLERNGYVERSFFRTGPGGVALVTRLERMNDDGSSAMASERWPSEATSQSVSDLFKFWRRLFFVEPGHYRIIVFILERVPFTQGDEGVTSYEAKSWLPRGIDVLPPVVGQLPFSSTPSEIAHCDALIYEFANDGSVERKVYSRLTGKQHLEKSGILTTLEAVSSE